MAQKKFAVTGVTGHTGSCTVERLLERGHAVRALAHREDNRPKRLEKMGAEVVIRDSLKFNDVRAAMRGVRGAYFGYPISPGILQATAYSAQAAKEASLECVVNMLQKSAREDAKSHAMCDHWLAERVFDWSGLTVAHLRDFRKTLESQMPLGQIGQTEDIAPAAVFFASSDSKWITGETLLIAGGLR
jgi:NAD(P)H dehydrogenase (quinone)